MKRQAFLRLLGFAGLSSLGEIAILNKNQKRSASSLLKPSKLSEGDTLGLISPASIIPERDRYGEIQSTLEDLGFKIKLGQYALERTGYLAGTDRQRAEDLNAMFADPDVDAIIPFRGGWGSNRILEYIDFKAIKNNPKPLVGFSDITSLLLSIYAKTGLITFHGPVGKSDWTDYTVQQFKKAVMTADPFSLHNKADQNLSVLRKGKAHGPLLGGNLTVLTSMLGSGYLPDFEGAVLFLEDVGEDVYRIDRMLTQLKLNGILDKISGLIFGQCTNCVPGNNYSFSLMEVLNDHIQPLAIPACYGSMIGHVANMFTLPVGLPATFDAGRGEITFSESAVT